MKIAPLPVCRLLRNLFFEQSDCISHRANDIVTTMVVTLVFREALLADSLEMRIRTFFDSSDNDSLVGLKEGIIVPHE